MSQAGTFARGPGSMWRRDCPIARPAPVAAVQTAKSCVDKRRVSIGGMTTTDHGERDALSSGRLREVHASAVHEQ